MTEASNQPPGAADTADLLFQSIGMDVSKYDPSFLKKSVQKRMTETGYDSREKYFAELEHSEGEQTALRDSLSNSYSEFFRNSLTFAVLERMILPLIMLKKKTSDHKEIRVWSAACASGQETYSLAILLEELKNDDPTAFSYRIFATDQSERQVHGARSGRYAAAAVQNLSLKRAETWFTRQDDVYTARKELKKHIDFSTFDLFNTETRCPPTSIFGDFDLVICANLLFYYKKDYRNIILGKAVHCLAPGGYLMTGETERDIVMKADFTEVFPQSAIFQA